MAFDANLPLATLDALGEACDATFGALWDEPERRIRMTDFRSFASEHVAALRELVDVSPTLLVLSELLHDDLVRFAAVDDTLWIRVSG